MASTVQDALRKVVLRSAAIFGTRINPTNVRCGAKHAKRKLIGHAKLNYYPEEFYISRMYKDMLKKYKNIEIEEDLLLVRKLATMQVSIADILQGKLKSPDVSSSIDTPVADATGSSDEKRATLDEQSSTAESSVEGRDLFLLPAHPTVYYKEARAKQLRSRGRGAPKKGQGKRLTIKKK